MRINVKRIVSLCVVILKGKKYLYKMVTRRNLLFHIVGCILISSCKIKATDEKKIHVVWNQHLTYCLDHNGRAAVNFIDTSTINYYNYLMEKIKTADSIEIEKMFLTEKILILGIRATISDDSLLEMTGKDLYARCIDKEWIHIQKIANNVLHAVAINNRVASAILTDSANHVSATLYFHKEGDKWKIDFYSFYKTQSEAISQYMTHQLVSTGQNEHEFIASICKEMNGIKPLEQVWHPIPKQK